jgi:large subunit ribosomal protein L34
VVPSVTEDPVGTTCPIRSRTSDSTEFFVKRTYQPKARRRSRKHGFRHRMSDRAGQSIIKARRRKGRHRLSA